MIHRAPRIHHYIGSLVAGCSLGGLLLAFGLAFVFRSIEDSSRAAEQEGASLSQVADLRRAVDAWADEARASLGVDAARGKALDEQAQDLLVRLGELREVP